VSRWRIKMHDGQGVTDLGPLPGRMGKKQIRQFLQGKAVRASFDDRRAQPIDPQERETLLAQAGETLVVFDAGDAIFTAEQQSNAPRT
jgi:hypothetical protein